MSKTMAFRRITVYYGGLNGRLYTTENPLRLNELFAAIGSQTQALTNIGIVHRVMAISEIDKYAIQSYEAMHGKANNLGDIRKIGELPDADLWTYSFPCQDISVAGKGTERKIFLKVA